MHDFKHFGIRILKKKILSIIIAILLSLITVVPVMAEPYLFVLEGDVSEENDSEENIYADDMPDSEELFAQYVDDTLGMSYYEEPSISLFSEDLTDSVYNSNMRANLSELEQQMYDKALELITGISNGELSVTEVIYSYSDFGFDEAPQIFVEDFFDTASGEFDQTKKKKAQDELNALYPIDAVKVLKALQTDNPSLLYWFGRSYNFNIKFKSSTTGAVDENGKRDGYVRVDSFRVFLSVAPFYSVWADGESLNYMADTAKTGATRTAVDNAKKIVDAYKSLTDYGKLVAYKEVICELTAYNYSAMSDSQKINNPKWGSNPWELIWVFDGNPDTNVVCEGYSKAFQYLCDLSMFDRDITVVSVGGLLTNKNQSDGHMWNIVHWDDSNYLVDVTNCDNYPRYFTKGHEGLFMKGYNSGTVSTGYTVIQNSIQLSTGNSTAQNSSSTPTSYIPEATYGYIYADNMLSLYSGMYSELTLSNSDFAKDTIFSTHNPSGEISFDCEKHSFHCRECDQIIEESHRYENLSSDECVICGFRRARLAGVSLTLLDAGTIGLNFDFINTQNYTDLKFELIDEDGNAIVLEDNVDPPADAIESEDKADMAKGKGSKLHIFVEDGNEYARATISVAAKDIPKNTRIILTDGGNVVDIANKSAVEGVISYSVLDYCNKIIGSSTDDGLVELCKAVKNYGLAAENYFKGTNNSVNIGRTNIDALLEAWYPEQTGTIPDNVAYVGTTLTLDSKIKVTHYFSGRVNAYADEINSELQHTEDGFKGSMYYFSVDNFTIPSLGDSFVLKVFESDSRLDEGRNSAWNIYYAPLSYLSKLRQNNVNNQRLTDVIYALADLYLKHNAYFE